MSGVGVTESLTTTCPCCNGQVTVAAGQTELVPVPGLADNAGSTQSLERRVSLAEHAKRAGMSRLSFHGKDRRKSMGLVETPGPGGVYLTPLSSARHVAEMHEKRETRRLNKR